MPPVAVLALAFLLAGGSATGSPRPHGTRFVVESGKIRVMDGDTAEIHWSATELETVRILGIDTAELRGRQGRIPGTGGGLDPRGAEARGFARGAFITAGRIELLRSATLDRYRRTLGYFFLSGRNYSVMAIEAGLSQETISRFGDNGLPEEARDVMQAAKRAGALAMERRSRSRTRKRTHWVPWR